MGLFNKFFSKKTLQKEQTAESVILKREFANHPSKGLTPQRLHSILEQAEQGNLIAQAELFMDMEEKDGHIQAEMHKRKMAVSGLDWQLQPPHDASEAEKKASAELEFRIRNQLDIEDILFDALDAIGHGYSCLELEWKQDKTDWFPEVKHRSPRWFTVNPHHPDKIRLRTTEHLYGDELQKMGWIVHIHKSRSGHLVRTGIHRALAWPYLYKNYSVRDLAELLEIYGLPIKVGKYSTNATDKEKKTLMRAIIGIGHNAGGIIPDSMQIDFINAASSASGDPFKLMVDWCEATQSKVILGNALSTMDSKGGSQALGTVHNEVRLDIRNNDARQLASSLTRDLVYPVAMLNSLFAEERCPKWKFDTQETDDLALYADALPKLAQSGAQIPISYVHDKLKIPLPEKGEAVLGGAATSPVAAMAALKSQKQQFTPEQQAIENLADAMPHISPIESEVIAAAIRAASSPEDLEQRLAVVMGASDLTKFSQTLEKALFAADVMGYTDA